MALESIVERAAGILGYSLKHERKDAIIKFSAEKMFLFLYQQATAKVFAMLLYLGLFEMRDSSNMSKRSIVIVISPYWH